MYDVTLVHVVKRFADLLHDDTHKPLVELLPTLEEGEELPRVAELLQQVDVLAVAEEGVQLHNVGVVQEGLDLDLPNELHCQLAVHIVLFDSLQGADETCRSVHHHEHLPKLPRTELLPHHEVGYRQPSPETLLLVASPGTFSRHRLG